MILELKGIYKDYQQGKMIVPVLKDVNFSMEEGEYVAIMGPSGSGKSTLMNIIGCLDQATKGTFFLDGQDISKCSENEMSDIRLNKIGFVFQSFHLLPRLMCRRRSDASALLQHLTGWGLQTVWISDPISSQVDRCSELPSPVPL